MGWTKEANAFIEPRSRGAVVGGSAYSFFILSQARNHMVLLGLGNGFSIEMRLPLLYRRSVELNVVNTDLGIYVAGKALQSVPRCRQR